MSWYLSDDIPQIPADILARLEAGFDRGDCFDDLEFERERGSVRRVIAINQSLQWRVVQLQTDLVSVTTNMAYMRQQIGDLTRRLRQAGLAPSRELPGNTEG